MTNLLSLLLMLLLLLLIMFTNKVSLFFCCSSGLLLLSLTRVSVRLFALSVLVVVAVANCATQPLNQPRTSGSAAWKVESVRICLSVARGGSADVCAEHCEPAATG